MSKVGDGPVGGPVRFAVPTGNTREEMREWLRSSPEGKTLHALGDCLLVWVNEGDLWENQMKHHKSEGQGDV